MAISYRTKVEVPPASEVIWIREDEDGDGSRQHELASFLGGDVPYRAYKHYEIPPLSLYASDDTIFTHYKTTGRQICPIRLDPSVSTR
jgi:hypothetical protein